MEYALHLGIVVFVWAGAGVLIAFGIWLAHEAIASFLYDWRNRK